MNRRLSGRLFHIPMLVVVSLCAAMAGVLFLAGHEYGIVLPLAVSAVLFYLLYGFLVIPRIYTGPATRLVEAVRTMAKGGTGVTWGSGFSGELLELRTALESLTGSHRPAGDPGDTGADPAATEAGAAMSLEALAAQVSVQTRAVTSALESVTGGCGSEVKAEILEALEDALNGARNLAWIAENLDQISRLEKAGEPSPQEFRFCDLVREVESEAAGFAGGCGTALITACDDSLVKNQVYTDRACLKGLLGLLVKEGMAACGDGTVTVLASLQKSEQGDSVELCVAHSERRFGDDDHGRGASESLFLHHEPVTLCLARRSCAFLGGSMEVEQSPGKGRVVTITVPARLTPAG